MELSERVQRLEDIEEIRYLQAKYQRCLDTRDFDGLAECFTDDAVSAYCDNKEIYHGKEEILNFLMSVMSLSMPSAHLIHGGEIDWISSEFAKAKWYLEDHLLHKKYLVKLNGTAIYECEYKKIDGKWLISSIGYTRNYEYAELRGPVNIASLHKTNYIKKIKKADPESLGEYGKRYKTKGYKKNGK